MGFIGQLLGGKDSDYSAEYKRFKKGMEQNSTDVGLKAQFIKFCLLNRFTRQEIMVDHIAEALKLYEAIANADFFDMQCHYLVGKYYQEEKDSRKAYRVYLHATKRFNQLALKSPGMRSDNAELAYSVALNLMTLQSNPVDPEVEVCFKILRKSFPLHLKRIEFENEMAKPAPDKARVKQLADEIRKLRAEEEKETAETVKEAKADPAPVKIERAEPAETVSAQTSPAAAKPKEPKGIFSKLFTELSPTAMGLSAAPGSHSPKADGGPESFKLAMPVAETSASGSAFLVFHEDQWEGPYTTSQLRTLGFLRHGTWVCRDGSQQVLQAYEVPDLQSLFQFNR